MGLAEECSLAVEGSSFSIVDAVECKVDFASLETGFGEEVGSISVEGARVATDSVVTWVCLVTSNVVC